MANKLWRNFINKPRLSSYISSPAEVGYNQYGPTFAVAGTMTALNAVVLVHNICAEINSKHKKGYRFLDWFAFRPPHYIMGNFSKMDLTMTSRFTISPLQAYEYNLIFADNGRYSEMKPLLSAVKDAWEEAIATVSKGDKVVNYESLFSEFSKLKLTIEATERLKTLTAWEPGEYQLKVRTTTESPKQIFDVEKNFILSEEDAKHLADNAAAIIADICQQPNVTYICATPALTVKNN